MEEQGGGKTFTQKWRQAGARSAGRADVNKDTGRRVPFRVGP